MIKLYEKEFEEYGVKHTMYEAYKGSELVATVKREEKNCWGRTDGFRITAADGKPINNGDKWAFQTLAEVKRAIENYVPAESGECSDPRNKEKYRPVRLLTEDPEAQFYPTPSVLVGKMLSKVNWENVGSILEPSAGKGDIIESLNSMKEKYQYEYSTWGRKGSSKKLIVHFHGNVTDCVDTIELDPNLRYVLKGKGYRVVWDDFLTFASPKRYDLILMNPPFAYGAEHLMKAIQVMEYGGQIVCLLNAETIRNQYTDVRKALNRKLMTLGASIEFVKGAFRHSERSSDVEVAVVYLNIPRKESKSFIWEKLQKAKPCSEDRVEAGPIVAGDWKEQLLTGYEMEARAGLALLDEYKALKPYIMTGDGAYDLPLIELKVNGNDNDMNNRFLRELRIKYWKMLLDRRELTEKMTASLSDKYHSRISEMDVYDFNIYNIETLLSELYGELIKGLEDSLDELFETLSSKHCWHMDCGANVHYYNGWAHNKAEKINTEKVILPINGYGSYGYRTDELESYEICRKIDDIEKCLSYLLKGQPVSVRSSSEAVKAATMAGTKTVSFTFFDATFYKKGTCHIKWHEDARILVDRLNIYCGKKHNWLPPSYGKKHYADMSEEEKTVINEYEGEVLYEKMMENPENYLIGQDDICLLMQKDA